MTLSLGRREKVYFRIFMTRIIMREWMNAAPQTESTDKSGLWKNRDLVRTFFKEEGMDFIDKPLYIGDASDSKISDALPFCSLACPLVDCSRVVLSEFSSCIISMYSSLVLTSFYTRSFSS
jgi:hypothetical protein